MKSNVLLILFFNLLKFFWLIKHVEAKLEAAGIVGGRAATLGQIKYQVSVQANNSYVCGGGIIDDRHILTAAHCVLNNDGSFTQAYFSIVAGSINAKNLSENALYLRVKHAYVPKEYHIQGYNIIGKKVMRVIADIAVLKLETELGLDKTSTLIKMKLPQISNTYSSYKNTNPIIGGFGLDKVSIELNPITNKHEEVPVNYKYNLNYAKTLVISNDICISLYNSPVEPSHICAQVKQNFIKKGRGICKGDSGSPLVLKDNTVIGVLSTGPIGCNEQKVPSCYTRVTYFLPFIHFALNDILLPNMRLFKYNL